jgi:hypothetical protein
LANMSRFGIVLLVFLAMLLAACSSAEEQASVDEEQATTEEEAAVEETSTEETTTEETTTEETTEPTEARAQATATRVLSEDEKAAVLACQIEKAERHGYNVQAALQEAINSDKLLTDVLEEDGYTCTLEEARALEMARQAAEAAAAQAAPQPEQQQPAPRPPNASEKADMCAQGISEACYSHEPQPRKSMSEKSPEERAPVVEQRVKEDPAVCNPQSNLSPAERAKYC